ncbi:MAG: four helix bundle protein [Candidatus Omnitrophica bacterium]|nr:four helix bundle protein [Candidatus Omnitrophota bacterium]
MASIVKFEDIQAWQEARQLTRTVYRFTRKEAFGRDRGLTDQIQRASVSSMTNVAEGFDSGSNAEFGRFLGYARRSASEVQSLLYVAQDHAYITEQEFAASYEQAEKVRRMATAFTTYLRGRQRNKDSVLQRAHAPTQQQPNTRTRQRANAQTH